MSILQAKYKAHRLVNSIFYIIIFFIGFLIGIGAKNIDFSKLASNILFIDNVSASESDNVFIKLGDLEITNNYIYSKLFDDTGYSYEDYPYVFLTYIYDVNRESYRELNLYAFSSVDDFVINYYNSFGTARYIINGRLSNVLYYEERYDYSTNEILHYSLFFFNTF